MAPSRFCWLVVCVACFRVLSSWRGEVACSVIIKAWRSLRQQRERFRPFEERTPRVSRQSELSEFEKRQLYWYYKDFVGRREINKAWRDRPGSGVTDEAIFAGKSFIPVVNGVSRLGQPVPGSMRNGGQDAEGGLAGGTRGGGPGLDGGRSGRGCPAEEEEGGWFAGPGGGLGAGFRLGLVGVSVRRGGPVQLGAGAGPELPGKQLLVCDILQERGPGDSGSGFLPRAGFGPEVSGQEGGAALEDSGELLPPHLREQPDCNPNFHAVHGESGLGEAAQEAVCEGGADCGVHRDSSGKTPSLLDQDSDSTVITIGDPLGVMWLELSTASLSRERPSGASEETLVRMPCRGRLEYPISEASFVLKSEILYIVICQGSNEVVMEQSPVQGLVQLLEPGSVDSLDKDVYFLRLRPLDISEMPPLNRRPGVARHKFDLSLIREADPMSPIYIERSRE
ncbi:putative signal peptide-containing protein [Cryptosporidium canis]|nr:putative signal peptide-containing protein [Cryptosporidium canis]